MADEYGELVELGFEGVDRFAQKFHDPTFDYVSKKAPNPSKRLSLRGKHKDQGAGHSKQQQPQQERQQEQRKDWPPSPERDQRGRDSSPHSRRYSPDLPPSPRQYPQNLSPPPPGYPPQTRWQNGPPPGIPPPPLGYPPQPVGYPSQPRSNDLPPHPQKNAQSVRPPPPRDLSPHQQRSRSLPPDSDSDSEGEDRRSMYSAYPSDRRRDDDRRGRGRDDGRQRGYDKGGYEKGVDESANYGYAPGRGTVAVRDKEASRSAGAGAGAVVPYPEQQYGEIGAARGRPAPSRQRSSTWSPPRREKRRDKAETQRVRSKSPNHYRAAAVIIGALAGGVAGSRVKSEDRIPNTISTVAGAIIGGLGAREAEKAYDRQKNKKHEEEERGGDQGNQRDRRRREREY